MWHVLSLPWSWVCGRTHSPSRFSCYLWLLSVSISTQWINYERKSEGMYMLLCWTICKPVNAAVIKGYHGRGHPAGGPPASTRSGAQRSSFTLRHPPATALVCFDIHRGRAPMKISLENCTPSNCYVLWNTMQFFPAWAGMGCWDVFLFGLVSSEVAIAILPPLPLPPPVSPASSSLTPNNLMSSGTTSIYLFLALHTVHMENTLFSLLWGIFFTTSLCF